MRWRARGDECVDASRQLYYASHRSKRRTVCSRATEKRRKRIAVRPFRRVPGGAGPRGSLRRPSAASKKSAHRGRNLIRRTSGTRVSRTSATTNRHTAVARVPRPCGTATYPRLRCTTVPRVDAVATPCVWCGGRRMRGAGTNPRATVRGNVNTSTVVVPTTRRDARRVIILW